MSLLEDYIHTLSVCEKRLDALHVTLQFLIKAGAEQVAICLADTEVEGELVVRLSHGMVEASDKILKGGALGHVAAFEAFGGNRVIRSDDAAAGHEWVRTDLELRSGIEKALYLPISGVSDARAKGVLIIAGKFDDEGMERASAVGRALSEYLETHPVHVVHREEPLHSGSVDVTQGDLSAAYQRCIDTEDIFELSDRTMEYCLRFTRSEFGFVGYIDPANGFLTVPTLTKEIFPESEIEGKTMIFEKPGGLGGLVLDTDRAVVANDPLSHPASVGTPPGHLPIRKFMGVPCMIHGKKVGMIALANKLDDYTRADLNLVEGFAALYATSVSSFFSQKALMVTNEKYMTLYNDAPVAYLSMDAGGNIGDINVSGKHLLQPEGEEMQNFNAYLDRSDKQLLNHRIEATERRLSSAEPLELSLHVGDTIRTVLFSMTPDFDERGYLERFHCSLLDISERKAAEAQLNFLAYHDEATRIPNRTMMRRYLEQALARAKRQGQKVGLLFFDLDRFKTINDTLGHAVGDELLKAVAVKLKKHFREADLLSRFGGDEFILIVEGIKEAADLTTVARKLLNLFAEPFRVGERNLYISSSIGISLYPDDAMDAEEMIKNADTAMYRGKEQGGNNFTFYQQYFNLAAHDRLALEGEMRDALKAEEFVLHYQPQYAIDGGIIGFEALLRWNHGKRGMISPLVFIPLAEENGFISALGEWALEKALKQLRSWNDLGYRDLKMAVNVSAKQFLHSDSLFRVLRELLERYALDPGTVCIEITESILANLEELCRSLNLLKTLGVSFAVDDFGTGYSSLTYLRKLPVSVLKIDKSFVDDIGKSPDDEAISRAIISMAHSMGMQVVAEGVEREEHLAFLRENGCDYYQGYYSSGPLPPEEATELLRGEK